MVLFGRHPTGARRSGTTPRCAGRTVWIENASMLPSGFGIPATPMKLSVLMSASVALTSADTRAVVVDLYIQHARRRAS